MVYTMDYSDSGSSSTRDISDDENEVIIEAMEAVISDLHCEVKQLKQTIDELNARINTLQSIHNTDLINKIFKYV